MLLYFYTWAFYKQFMNFGTTMQYDLNLMPCNYNVNVPFHQQLNFPKYIFQATRIDG